MYLGLKVIMGEVKLRTKMRIPREKLEHKWWVAKYVGFSDF